MIKMQTNKDKFLALVSEIETETIEEVKLRIENKSWLKVSKEIAIKVLLRLDELGWSQKMLAEKMNVSPQQINKIVRGQENLTLATILRLEENLEIQILIKI